MRIIALLLVAFVALSHVTFLILEMFYWNDPVGRDDLRHLAGILGDDGGAGRQPGAL